MFPHTSGGGPGREAAEKVPFGVSIFPALPEISDEELAAIGAILQGRRGFSLAVYKDTCMKRRVAIRIRSTRSSDAAAYCGLLSRSDQELDLLQKSLTIHVSQFFRNRSVFEKLRREVIPEFFASRADGPDEPLRLWSLGCAGGEEPYSLAIMLREFFGREIRHGRVSLMATDIDEKTLQAARAAEYDEGRFKEMPVDLRERYFRRNGRLFRLIPEIRDMVTFRRGDICNLEEYVPSDLVFCRNTLIYFARPEQERILNGIADALRPGGILVLGKSEVLTGSSRGRFAPVCRVERIYRRMP
ncbi:protein-glutamate O-methyltransferase CheR [Geobacter sp. FeAm09]|uniref:CheR family methyltransferase n=1 Tax=Geobacter sp. FeAm09 TaxID=2597769 RepID=UPI0011ED5109|nr:protein-glutamate O-methyltransferase CheR [Geobacter sp. FeAm09]QEM69733.1 protein-glutamate O-methyltransferase CheR [Geobacter sp. FeAm09]